MLLPSSCHMLKKKNIGIITYFVTNDRNVFEYLFMCIGASMRAFCNCNRPVIAIDITHLKRKYKNVLFMNSVKDGNNQIIV